MAAPGPGPYPASWAHPNPWTAVDRGSTIPPSWQHHYASGSWPNHPTAAAYRRSATFRAAASAHAIAAEQHMAAMHQFAMHPPLPAAPVPMFAHHHQGTTLPFTSSVGMFPVHGIPHAIYANAIQYGPVAACAPCPCPGCSYGHSHAYACACPACTPVHVQSYSCTCPSCAPVHVRHVHGNMAPPMYPRQPSCVITEIKE